MPSHSAVSLDGNRAYSKRFHGVVVRVGLEFSEHFYVQVRVLKMSPGFIVIEAAPEDVRFLDDLFITALLGLRDLF